MITSECLERIQVKTEHSSLLHLVYGLLRISTSQSVAGLRGIAIGSLRRSNVTVRTCSLLSNGLLLVARLLSIGGWNSVS